MRSTSRATSVTTTNDLFDLVEFAISHFHCERRPRAHDALLRTLREERVAHGAR